MTPGRPLTALRSAAILAIVLGALILVSAYQGEPVTAGEIGIGVIVIALSSLRRLGR